MANDRKTGSRPEIRIQQSGFLVYIAGVHVPALGINVNFGLGSFPTATVSLPADSTLVRIGNQDRVPLTIFYLDNWYSQKGEAPVPTWRLLFDGDITQWSYSRSSASKMMSVNAISHMSILNFMSLIYLNGSGRQYLQVYSRSQVESQSAIRNENLQVLSFFKKGPYGGKNVDIDRPMDFVNNLLLGMKIGGPPDVDSNLNTFANRVTTVDQSLRGSKKSSTVNGEDYVDLRDKSVQNYPVSASSEFFIKYNFKHLLDKRWISSNLEDVTLMTSGPQNVDEQDTRDIPEGEQLTSSATTRKVRTVPDDAFKAVVKFVTFEAMKSRFSQKRNQMDSFWSLIDSFYNTVMYDVLNVPTAELAHVGDGDTPQSSDTGLLKQRLANCLSVPDMTFALPPACNVFIPGMIRSFGFAEDIAKQNTRVILDGSSVDVNANRYVDNDKGSLRFGYPADQNLILDKEFIHKRSPENLLIFPEEFYRGPVVSRPRTPPFLLTLEQSSLYRKKVNDDKSKKIAEDILNQEPTDEVEDTDRAYKVSAREWREELLYGYSKMHYLKNKYQFRNGTINMEFNPYVIPGMPFTMIDNDDFDQFHLTGMVTGISIEMSPSSASTNVTYAAGRTLKEVYQEVFSEMTFGPDKGILGYDNPDTKKAEYYANAPIYPIKNLADNLQLVSQAKIFYQNLLYSKDTEVSSKPFVFDYSHYFEDTSGSEIINANGSSVSAIKDNLKEKTFPGVITNVQAATVATPKLQSTEPGTKQKTYPYIKSFDLELKVKDSAYHNLDNYDLGMRKAARRICSLDDYMKFFNNGVVIPLKDRNVQKDHEFAADYPETIRLFDVDEDALADNYIRPFAATSDMISGRVPELRRNWPKLLKDYRQRVKNNAILGK